MGLIPTVIIPTPNGAEVTSTPAFAGCADAKINPLNPQGADLARVRDVGAERALRGDSAVIVFVDADNQFTFDALRSLVKAARECRGVVGVPYLSSNTDAAWNVLPRGAFYSSGEVLGEYSPGVPAPVDGVGTGMMAIHRPVFAAIRSRFPELCVGESDRSCAWFRKALFSSDVTSKELSMDWSFCWRALQAGCEVRVLSGLDVTHRGRPAHGALNVAAKGLSLGTHFESGTDSP